MDPVARPIDTLQPAWRVYYYEIRPRCGGDSALAMRFLNNDVRSGARVAFLDTRELPPAFWKDHRIALHPFGNSCFAEHEASGEAVDDRLLISGPRPEPTEVVLRPVRWLVGLLRELFGKKPGDPEEPQTSEAWLRWAVGKWPKTSEENPAAYSRRLYEKPKAREFWNHERNLYTKLYEYGLMRKKGD
jgi:hypothetical protein